MHNNIGELDRSSSASTLGAALGMLFVLFALLAFVSILIVAVRLRKKLKNKLKPQKPRQYLDDHDYATHMVEPHQIEDGHDKNEGESFELKESDEAQTDKDKDYYFMDTTLIGEIIKLIGV